jgi:hypothetical protein
MIQISDSGPAQLEFGATSQDRIELGVKAGPVWDAADERRAFLRTLRGARLRAVN